jgi:PTS system ascorbate-specific IIA component
MAGLMIIAHAPLASALKTVAEHTFPECAGALAALDVAVDMPIETVEAQAREMLARVRSPEALVFADVFGATPCNVAQRIADGVQVRVVAGVNVPMLWRVLCYAGEPLDAVVARALDGASKGVMKVAPAQSRGRPA